MTAYAAYLRIYEPVSAFHQPDRSRWMAYADSATRPRRRDSLAVEHAEALRRAITTPWVAMPERESEHCGDQSVAEIRAAIDGAARGEHELAVAMYMRARHRWRAFAEFELAN